MTTRISFIGRGAIAFATLFYVASRAEASDRLRVPVLTYGQ
ncbi:MAG: hypothetical protein SGI99_01960 [Pseudomonadota bacterium]|nr:hypothetical protein [Pseudomonadota bacterium]